MRAAQAAIILALIAAAAIGVWAYPALPERVPSHWDLQGRVNGYSSRLFAVAFVPALMLALTGLLLWLPRIDPLRENYASFRGSYEGTIAALDVYILYVHSLILASGVGFAFNFTQLLVPSFGALFVALGVAMGRVKRNWFMGVRTPWTLSSDEVWDRTHRFAGKAFSAAGAITFTSLLFPDLAIWLLLVPVSTAGIGSIAYSYWIYTRIKKPENS